jgi:hypothetical protein
VELEIWASPKRWGHHVRGVEVRAQLEPYLFYCFYPAEQYALRKTMINTVYPPKRGPPDKYSL